MTKTYTAKLSMIRGSQVVRIPKALAFEGVDKVEIIKSGKDLMLRPVEGLRTVEKKSREEWLADLLSMEPCPDFEPCREPIIDPERFLRLMESGEEGEK
ncbi:MAG: AbrB/MazE/SpoVT family DNA-binding domain-containing protein [Rhodocyclaceae bacterium]|nr:AbrB/MazE/SpoVT family DNA-binding domain-containing protein [Rhodocyclaceae bacterium]